MQAYQADIAKFEAANTKVFGISMDAFPSLKAFAESIKVTSVPMLSDWGRTTTKAYGLYNEQNGYGRRATFVVDKEGKIARSRPAASLSTRPALMRLATCWKRSWS